jgi:ketosteroid isomerase-like protein
MSEENIDLIKRIYAGFNNREYDELVENFGDDFEWFAADNSPLADRSPYHGIKEVREGVFGRIELAFKRLNVEIDEIIEAGNRVIILGYYEGEYATGGKAPRAQLAHIWTLANGKAIKFQQYVDTYAIASGAKAAAE